MSEQAKTYILTICRTPARSIFRHEYEPGYQALLAETGRDWVIGAYGRTAAQARQRALRELRHYLKLAPGDRLPLEESR